MDDTQQSRTSEAAATRKRRSSILKSQRPARTPFSELEFNVATPTDTAKSRRVSFSRRTGVAEFVTNEATTTWKNFYEEHNKSLESSGNDSDANATRQPVEHLGRRIFDQQFEEVEAVDFVGNLNPSLSANASLNNINFSQAIEAVEFTTEGKVTAPHKKFELSTLPDQESKLFGNDFTVTGVGELSGKIDFNFSNIQRIGEKDDLEEIERDLERAVNNVVCQGPADRHNISEYIEIDLNTTHVAKSDDCDMSITDTVNSPKVQDISKSSSIDKKINLEKDWMTDKENIAVNPYAAPCETDNFAVNDEPNQVLVFDGKRLTLQTEQTENNRQSIIPNIAKERPVRKTIVLNTNDDLPNFIDEVSFKTDSEPRSSTAFHDPPEVCIKAVHKIDIVKRSSVHDNLGNLSITQSLPSNIMAAAFDKHDTTSHKDVAEDNISITQSINGQIITGNQPGGRRRTVVYEDETGNISITQALPTNILQNTKHEKRKTIVFDEDGGNMSITQGFTSQLLLEKKSEKRKTIVFDDDKGDISITQALPSQVIIDPKVSDKRKTIVFDDDNGNISITQALPANIVLESQRQEKRKTIIYEDNTGNISITQAAPTNLILTGSQGITERRRTILYEDDAGNISVTQAIPQNIILGKTERADDTNNFDACDISMTQALPTNIILKDSVTNKRRTIVYDDDTGNISITQAIPSQLIPGIVNTDAPNDVGLNSSPNISSETVNKCKTVVDENVGSVDNIALSSQSSPTNEIIDNTPMSSDFQINSSSCVSTEIISKSKTVIYDDISDISMTQAIPSNIILSTQGEENEDQLKEETVIFENDLCDDNLSEDLPANAFLLRGINSSAEEIVLDVSDNKETLDEQISKQVFNDPASVVSLRKREAGCMDEKCETEITITEPMSQILIQEIRKTQSLDRRTLSSTKPIPDQLFNIQSLILDKPMEKLSSLCDQTSICKENQNVVIYQTVTSDNSPTLSKIDHQDTNSGMIAEDQSNDTTSSKVDDSDITESTSSKEPSDQTSLLSKDNAGHVIESKIEIFDINIPEVESKTAHSITNNSLNITTSKTSVLHNLLDMTEPIYDDFLEKSAEVNTDSSLPPEPEPSKESSIIHLVIDQDAEMQTDQIEIDNDAELTESESDNVQLVRNSPLSIEYKDQEDNLENTLNELLENTDKFEEEKTPLNDHLQNTLEELIDKRDKNLDDKSITDEKGERISRHKSLIQANDMKSLQYIEEERSDTFSIPENGEEKPCHKSFKDANDTKELLDMICDFTDTSRCESKETTNSVKSENKGDAHESKRLSFATKRQSIVISREDLLNNISMAQAILQKSRVEFNDTGLTEDNQDSSPEDATNVSRRSARMSNEVVKTLHFDDESISENSLKSDLSTTSPLKKITFGETSFKKSPKKSNVIPTYLKDVSDGIKQLMADLVKPMADAVPFENCDDRYPRKSLSTVSTQIQANLTTSSQIDVEADLSSGPSSRENIDDDEENVDDIRSYETRTSIVISDIGQSSIEASGKSSESNVVPTKLVQSPCSPVNNVPRVLVFDHENPLNNILLGHLGFTNAHDYKPRAKTPVEILTKKSDETLCGSDRSESCQINMEIDTTSTDTDTEQVARDVEVNTEAIVAQYCTTVHGFLENRQMHKPASSDRAVHVHSTVENIEVNTVIAMKPNNELLKSSSCLTLIEDALPESESNTTSSQYFVAKKKELKSPTKVNIGEAPDIDIDMTSTDDDAERIKSKGKKRSHIPGTPNRRASVDVTPKPNTKMQRISNSPNTNRILLRMSHEPTKLTAERDTEGIENHATVKSVEDKIKTENKSPNRGFNSSITIQQLITDYKIDAGINKEILDILKDNDFCKSGSLTTEPAPESVTSDSLSKVCSFTSSKNQGSKRPQSISTSASSPKSQSTFQSAECTRIEWHPELCSMAANKNVSYIDSGVNIVSKIDMLPFMGSYECERETSLADTWSFRLLHGRIRLTVRLAHRHDNATRTRVRADTPVTEISVDTIEYDKKNPVAILCIQFACETMRYMVSSASDTSYLARDIPLILRRCAAVARVALRWGRSMHDAKLHLAYTLNTEGFLTLKVANIPLRSVWEVSMELELVVEHPSQAPWPRAGNVKVNRVVSDVPVSDDDVRKILKHIPNDWGHVPKTLWRIFRYLKHKQRDDDELLMGV